MAQHRGMSVAGIDGMSKTVRKISAFEDSQVHAYNCCFARIIADTDRLRDF